jgi:cobaltochelatase CobN
MLWAGGPLTMHFLRTESRSLDEAEQAKDLGQSPAEIVFLSFSDADLATVAAAAKLRKVGAPSLRLANLAELRHPYSVDLYVETVASKARFVLVRLLGGLDYWRYGVDELSAAARRENFMLALVPGDAVADPRLEAASTLPAEDLRSIHAAFKDGGASRIVSLLGWIEAGLGHEAWCRAPAPAATPAAGRFAAGCRTLVPSRGRALILFYRALLQAGDTAPITALADALAARGLDVTSLYVTSLKDTGAIAGVGAEITRERPDVIINTTGFSARLDDRASVLDLADAPVLQAFLAGSTEARWNADPRGLGATDLAMSIVLPEMDGRLVTRAISCKAPTESDPDLEFTGMVHKPMPSRVVFVADLALSWVRLRKTPRAERKLACVLSDYPSKGGRGGFAVGLDTPKSVLAIADLLRDAGYTIGSLPPADTVMRHLEHFRDAKMRPDENVELASDPIGSDGAPEDGATPARLSLEDYVDALAAMPAAFVDSVTAQWGPPEDDPHVVAGAFTFAILQAGNLLVALQPCRGKPASHKSDYHDVALPPCHAYVAFYAWLRRCAGLHALIHCGTHGTLEWLPGKAVALGETCAPEVVLGPLPVIYPFIVNNPGEAAQAKRRIAALTIGHLTPPLTAAGSHGAALEIEALLDEYAVAETLDPKRAKLLARAILDRAEATGLLRDSGLAGAADPVTALRRLDAFLCDLKDMRIADGLHVFGRSPVGIVRDATASCVAASGSHDRAVALLDLCGPAEREALVAALDGRFVQPGPGGAPARGRLDVLPTGRNLYGTDPRAMPTRTATEIGRRAAQELVTRYAQDHGEWPQRIVLDLWASATMRTGGEDLAQALALLGVRPVWDTASTRVSGFEILPLARMAHPRVDVTLRISGLFRDLFPAQIALFDQAVQAVAVLDEDAESNPLAARRRRDGESPMRIFGAAPGTYGLGLSRAIDADATTTREKLGETYLAATSHAYGIRAADGMATSAFRERVAGADALVHVQDLDGGDLLDSDAAVDHEGGFAAAAERLGATPSVYHLDATRTEAIKVRSLAEEVARVVRARAANPCWIRGLMRHGHRGAAEIAEAVDHLFALAILTDAVESRHFELLYEATCGAPEVRAFLVQSNPLAARAIAERFEAAAARGFWQSRRNSTAESFAAMREAAA